ncbi:MAG: YhcN/YlaJ family sporulation lipoprotein [Clostridiales bacterium]|nr:YhcN/YlaJ family sporulation lipoprotein [Clostridiales bacterium]
MKNRKILIAISIFIISMLIFVACQPAEKPGPEEDKTPPLEQAPLDDTIDKQQGTDPTNGNNNNNNNMNDSADNNLNQDLVTRSEKIVDEVVKVNGVESATVVISENTAIVGVDLEDDKTGELGKDVEMEIKKVVEETDEDIDEVAITADPDLFTRVENLANDFADGKPLSGLGNEIEEIFRKINPTT